MPIHDWSRVAAGIFHDFHIELITRIKHALNDGILPPDYYAMAEQVAAGDEPDVLTLHAPGFGDAEEMERTEGRSPDETRGGILLARPKVRPIARTEMESYRHNRPANTLGI